MKKVLVTGGTQGVGLETAKLLLEQGYEVHITYRRSAGKAEELMAANPGRLFAHSWIRARSRRSRTLTSWSRTSGTA